MAALTLNLEVSGIDFDAAAQAAARRLDVWRTACARVARLDRMFADPDYLDRLICDGRYLRLCAAHAIAACKEERARLDVNADAMVEALRNVGARTPASID